MAFANDLTLNPGSYGGVAANKTFVLIGPSDGGQGSLRRDSSTGVASPYELRIRHTVRKVRGATTDVHNMNLGLTLTDPVLGVQTVVGNFTLSVPRGTSVFTTAVLKDLQGHLISALLQSGHTDKFLNGES